jgi:putative exosortase-associated protein (TIGR04073 family)
MVRRFVLIVAMVGGLLGGTPAVWAQDPIHKMGRGMVNILTGWLELPKHLHLGTQASNPVTGMMTGLLKGAGLMLLRSGVGLYEAATFPLPVPKGFASPYERMELNDYAWE